MKKISMALRSLNGGMSCQFHHTRSLRSLSPWMDSAGDGINDQQTNNSGESAQEIEQRIFGDIPGRDSKIDTFFDKIDRLRIGKGRDRYSSRQSDGGHQMVDDLDISFDTLSDGMDGRLHEASRYFEYDSEEVDREDYSFRYDMTFHPDTTYDVKDLDLTKPGVPRPPRNRGFTVTTEEVLRKADFRNVRFLENFLTEAGIIIKRSQTGISAKAQRKVAREIKTARAFGLMPFTTMGTKKFTFGENMEDRDEDYEYEGLDNRINNDIEVKGP